MADAQVVFAAGLAASGQQTGTLRVNLPAALRPGNYKGQITFTVDRPPAGSQVLLPAPIPVALALARPAVQVESSTVDFGSVLFDTSANFRISQPATITVSFNETPFQIVPALSQSTCEGLSVAAGEPATQGGKTQVPLVLRSSGPVRPQTCTGTIALNGPSEDYEIQANRTIGWRLVVPEVEWQLVGIERGGGRASDMAFGNIGRPGDRGSVVLLIRYTGQPPFSLDLLDLQGQADRGQVTISESDVELVTGSVSAQPGEAGVYRVPVELVASRSLPHLTRSATWLLGTDYSGKFHMDIAGLPNGNPLEVGFRLHNPGWTQRYIAPFYTLIWPGVVTYPLSIIVPLVLLAFVSLRKKDADVERFLRSTSGQSSAAEADDDGMTPGGAPVSAPGAPLLAAAARASSPTESRRATRNPVPRRPTRPGEGSPGHGASTPGPTSAPRQTGHGASTPGPTSAPRQPAPAAQRAARPASPPSRPRRSKGTTNAK